MSPIKKNIVANYFGSVWQGLMSLAFIPLYIKFIGIESYGLVGIYSTFLAIFSILDLGVSSAIGREVAKPLHTFADRKKLCDLMKTLQAVCWITALLVAVIAISLSPFAGNTWIVTKDISHEVIEHTFILMALALFFQWPSGFYISALMGLGQQVNTNVIGMLISTARGGGACLVLWLISPTIESFFIWQIATNAIQTWLYYFFLNRALPAERYTAKFSYKSLEVIWKFAIGVSGFTILSLILTQSDKIIMSKMLSLEMFGYYTLATTMGLSLLRIMYPVASSVYPNFIKLASLGEIASLSELYHKSCQLMSILLLPVALIAAIFSYEVIFLWTQSEEIAKNTYLLARFLILGMTLNGLVHIPCTLMLAFGVTRYIFKINLMALIIQIPLLYILVSLYGAIGGSSVWLILYIVIAPSIIYIVNQKFLLGGARRWYMNDVIPPFLASLLIIFCAKISYNGSNSNFYTFLYLLITYLMTLISAGLSTTFLRGKFLNVLKNIFRPVSNL